MWGFGSGSSNVTKRPVTSGGGDSDSTKMEAGEVEPLVSSTDDRLEKEGTSSSSAMTPSSESPVPPPSSSSGSVIGKRGPPSRNNSTASMGTLSKPFDKGSSSSSSNAEQQQQSLIFGISKIGLMVLLLLACQNCAKNLVMRFVMKDQPKFLTSAAVLGSECLKLTLSVLYILLVQKRSVASIVQFLKDDMRNTLLLIVPASAYNFQTSMEYVALANLNAAMFSVLVQTKLLFTATFAATILRKQLRYLQVISLVLLTVGVMLCNLKTGNATSADASANATKGILATLGIAVSSGFASVFTEKVIKGSGIPRKGNMDDYGLAYTQVQLAGMSILAIGLYAIVRDWSVIVQHGLFYNFTAGAALSCVMSGTGGLLVASVLKYADSILKGYATALSVILTGVLSMLLFGTHLSTIYFLGICNVICAVILYNGKDLHQFICKKAAPTVVPPDGGIAKTSS